MTYLFLYLLIGIILEWKFGEPVKNDLPLHVCSRVAGTLFWPLAVFGWDNVLLFLLIFMD